MVGRIRNGVILIVIGVIFLLHTLDVIHLGFWEVIWNVWPVILIAIGIEKIFGATRTLRPLAYLSPVLILMVLAWAVIADSGRSAWSYHDDWSSGSHSEIYVWSEEGSSSTKLLDLTVEKTRGRLVVRNGAAEGNLLDGRLRYWGRRPRVKSEEEESTLAVRIEDRDRGTDAGNGRDVWVLRLTGDVPIRMSIDGGAARMRLDFSALQLEDLTLDAGAVDVDLTFGSLAPVVVCAIECAAAALDITVPASAGVSIERQSIFSGFSARGLTLVERGSMLITPDFDEQPVQIKLDFRSDPSTLRIHRVDEADEGDGAETESGPSI